jgi:hypothetical protein
MLSQVIGSEYQCESYVRNNTRLVIALIGDSYGDPATLSGSGKIWIIGFHFADFKLC